MTQKELLYVEDAINHERNIVYYLNDAISSIQNKELTSFLEDEIIYHEEISKKLLNLLDGEINER